MKFRVRQDSPQPCVHVKRRKDASPADIQNAVRQLRLVRC